MLTIERSPAKVTWQVKYNGQLLEAHTTKGRANIALDKYAKILRTK